MDKRIGIAGAVVVVLALVVAKGCGAPEADYQRGSHPDVPKNWSDARFKQEIDNIRNSKSLGPAAKDEVIEQLTREAGRSNK
jgi:hypothetical protein